MTSLVGKIGCAAVLAVAVAAFPAWAGDITTEWSGVKPPPVPELKPVTVDSKTTGCSCST
jgi:hypothetical protein